MGYRDVSTSKGYGSSRERLFIQAAVEAYNRSHGGTEHVEVSLDDTLADIVANKRSDDAGKPFIIVLQTVRFNAQWGMKDTNPKRDRDLQGFGITAEDAATLQPFIAGQTRVSFADDVTAAERKHGIAITGRYTLEVFTAAERMPHLWKAERLENGYPVGAAVSPKAPMPAVL